MRSGFGSMVRVLAIAVLVFALLVVVMGGFLGNFNIFEGITSTGISEQDRQAAQVHCNNERKIICNDDDITGTDWANRSRYGSHICWWWIKREGILGGPDILECGDNW